jgi:uncharacterized protein (DUF1800 family)
VLTRTLEGVFPKLKSVLDLLPGSVHLAAINGGYAPAVPSLGDSERKAIARLTHRVGFGPAPGEFAALLNAGVASTVTSLLEQLPETPSADIETTLGLTELGPRPKPNTPQVVEYSTAKRDMARTIRLWWLDRMVTTSAPLQERMTWFWHGHWATSYVKVDEPIVMFRHINRLRQHALGNFNAMAREMIVDGALVYWLDGHKNTSRAPNENLARELMELFTLGVNQYSENDVKEVSKILTGYKVEKYSGTVSRNLRQAHRGAVEVLGKRSEFDALTLVDHLVSRPRCQEFIAERLWFRFATSSLAYPKSSGIDGAFSQREIRPLVTALITSPEFLRSEIPQVKSPLEWMVAALRALSIVPSSSQRPDFILNALTQMGQIPYSPPSVGGWPADEAWLSAASAQTKIQVASFLTRNADLSPIADVSTKRRVSELADLLGIPHWSQRTLTALQSAIKNPPELMTLALCSPEFQVNG